MEITFYSIFKSKKKSLGKRWFEVSRYREKEDARTELLILKGQNDCYNYEMRIS